MSSPYTRALQTAAVISRKTGLEIKIETDLHEWLPDLSFQYNTKVYSINAAKECTQYKGACPAGAQDAWEDLSAVANRAYRALSPYGAYRKIIVVSHGVVMRQFVFQRQIPYCGILETEFDSNFVWHVFIET